ncbi:MULTISPECIES: metal-sensing transcriptional repressor [Pseudomonadaceae]|uniref:metal-sensing transcriptional repressor n=1 Tax=Pseudomonadaceae TaxID=135621 RepID=UPI0005EF6C7A|nr:MULTISPECIES: metal-sensing transcriptional repressor [Pseudomonadaceae]AZZ47684.1 transcriptional regulator [Pseudomonadaceae bacterium SI-3]MAL35168.1 transcriptional regulator [Pseudomonas sp.]MBU0949405.1 metal-sensing transcriptional repressor [Gammaproteobacteria bacterium]KJJ64004.1 copper-sensitive operon repressor [Pseudomonas sp. 10B238]MBK3795019.1 metal-sensing transcriptional repressor [Stutzerimonas stutzeri]
MNDQTTPTESVQLQDQQQAMLKRLARVEGQVRGIQAMIKRGEDCESIAQQFSAARSALDKAYRLMLTCLIEEAMHDQAQDTGETLARVRSIFTKYT